MSGPRLSESQWQALESTAAAKYGIPAAVLATTRGKETGGRDTPGVPTKYGVAQGYYQSMPATVAKYGFNPHDPASAADGTARLWRDNLASSGGNVQEAARMYNGSGPDARAYAADFMRKYDGGKSASGGGIGDMGFTDPSSAPRSAPSSGDDLAAMGLQDPSAPAPQAPAAAQTAPTQTDDPVAHARAEIDAMAGDQAPDEEGLTVVVHDNTPSPYDRSKGGLLTGLSQGTAEVYDTVKWAISKIPGIEIARSLLNEGQLVTPTSEKTLAQQAQDGNALTKQYEAEYSAPTNDPSKGWDNMLAGAGRLGGNMLALDAPMAGLAAYGRLATKVLPAALKAADFLAGNAGGNLLTRTASRMANGAVMGGAAGTMAGQDPMQSAEGGAVLGPAFGALGDAASGARNMLAPKIDPYIASLAQKASDMGINVRGSQISGSPAMRTLDSVLARVPGTGMAADNAAQRTAFTRAIGKTFGADADRLTPEVMQQAKDKIGGVYNDVSNRVTLDLHPDRGNPFVENLANIKSNAQGVLDTTKLPALDHLIENITSKIGPDGTMPGRTFQALTSKGGMLDLATKDGNSSYAAAAKALKANLNAALESSAAPEDAAALKAADWQWKNMKTVEKLIAKSPDGTISPALLQNPVSTSFSNRAYTGAGDLGDLGDIGQMFLKDQGSSNTAERGGVLGMLLGGGRALSSVGAGALGYQLGANPLETLAGAVAAPAATSLVGRGVANVLKSPGYRNRLIQGALGEANPGIDYMPYLLQPSVLTANRLRSVGPVSR